MTINVFADLHHSDLYFSLHLLFEKRLGWKLYRPIGLDWFHAGYWKIAEPYGNAMDTVGQYLDIAPGAWDQHKNLNGNHYVEDGTYNVFDPVHDYHQRAITFDQFRSMKFDVILPTIASHDRPYEQLRNAYQPQAKMIAHLGNIGQRTHLPNVIHSVPYNRSAEQNVVLVHQELDSNLYGYIPTDPTTKNIYSMVNCLPYSDIYSKYKSLLSEVNMKAHGGGCPDGALFGCRGVAEKMKEANIGWQLKPQGGLGHTAMGWFYSGRPVITNMSQNRGLPGPALQLFEPGTTCHDIEAHTVEENCRIIRRMLEPEENVKWCERAARRFRDIINYNAEEQAVRLFIERLK